MYPPGTICLIIQAPPKYPDLLNTTVTVGDRIGPHRCTLGAGCWVHERILQSLTDAQHPFLQRGIDRYGPVECAYPIAFMRPIDPPKDPDAEQASDDRGLVHHRVRYPLTTQEETQ